MANIGDLYRIGTGVSQDFAEAKGWYEKAAAVGNAVAMIRLGDIYRYGRGVAISIADARTWYEKAAAAGSTDAQKRLAALPSK